MRRPGGTAARRVTVSGRDRAANCDPGVSRSHREMPVLPTTRAGPASHANLRRAGGGGSADGPGGAGVGGASEQEDGAVAGPHGLRRSRGALYQALARLADKAMPTYQGLVQAARQSLVNRVDETGWRVGGVPWYLWVFVSDEVTVYAILHGRGFQQAASVLGAEYRGWLLHDGWIAYYLFLLACHQSCLEHLIRRCREMAEIASAVAAEFPLAVKALLQQALDTREHYEQAQISPHGLCTATGQLEARMDRLLAKPYRTEANRRLAKHLRHEQPYLFTFLHCPGLDATNHLAEQA